MSSTDTPIAEIPGDTLRERIVDDLRAHIGADLVDSLVKPGDDVWVRVSTDAWRRAGVALREMGFEYFCFLSAIDWMPSPFGKGEDDPTAPPVERDDTVKQGYAGGATRLQVLARLVHPTLHVGVNIKCDVSDSEPVVESWSPIFAGANWHERETFDMFGIIFDGHPGLTRILMPDDWQGHPQRKDYALGGIPVEYKGATIPAPDERRSYR